MRRISSPAHRKAAVALSLLLGLTGCAPDAEPAAGTPSGPTGTAASAPASPAETPGPATTTAPDAAEEPAPHVQAVVSSHELATAAGTEILEAGGTAADAAVAVAAVLSVVEPYYSSVLGGGTWALYYDADSDDVTSLNGVGPVGGAATLEDYRPRAGDFGMHQAILPGAWDGWMLWLDEYGELGLGEVLAPAIAVAREGYPASSEMVYWLTREEANIRQSPVMTELYTRDGALLEAGDTVHQWDMAGTFEDLVAAYDGEADGGADRAAGIRAARDHFYRGPVAEAVVAFSEQDDGYLTLEDFSGYSAQIVEPISIDYGADVTVHQNPPNSQGIAMLQALNILDEDDFSGRSPEDPDVVHRQVEAVKLAFADRYARVGDPERTDVPVARLLSDEYARAQRARIDDDRAARWPIDSGLDRQASDTTTFHLTDRSGNAAAVTTSLGGQFLVVGDTGIHINERMSFLSLDEDNVNAVAPGATVRHTSAPFMALRDGRPYLLGGNTGIDTQPQGQLQQFMNVVDFGMTPQEAVAQPRFVSTAFPASNHPHGAGNTLQVESDFSAAAVQELRRRGHDVTVGAGIFGTANMLAVDEDGRGARLGVEPRNETADGTVLPAPDR
ncbi:gamma-glutamyltransferase family protein [uncultured Kocuria sp.]|uniref:gamma-glutamyltransferase family protein n=1 Tax=uncultured Kocuria sp. TaxID=259305 RepID=UPI00260BDEEA|nr:gamma-glutamyltransferase [uncultured Kocuria sp.]